MRLIFFFLLLQISLNAQNMGIKLPVGTTPNTVLDINGSLAYREGTARNITATPTNSLAIDSMSFYRITTSLSAAFTITGFTGGLNGRVLTLHNTTIYPVTFANETGSSLANQITTGTGANVVIGAGGTVTFYYNLNLQKWLCMAATGVASSGAGWGLTGNSGTVDGTNFIGTTDNIPFNIRVNNAKAGKIDHLLHNIFLGYQAANANTLGSSNIAIGHQTLLMNTTAGRNVAIGEYAMITQSFINGGVAYNTDNTAIGYQALSANQPSTTSDAKLNAAVGFNALKENTRGANNTATGATALQQNTTGNNNTALGSAALLNNTQGHQNTGVGQSALSVTTSGGNNTAVGYQAGITNLSGNNNTLIGYQADVATNALSNATAIGYSASVAASNSLVLGGTSANAVNVGIGTTTPAYKLHLEEPSGSNGDIGIRLYNNNFATYQPSLVLQASKGTKSTPAALAINSLLGVIRWGGYDGSVFNDIQCAEIGAIASENWSTTGHGTKLAFNTIPNATLNSATRMTINEDGYVGIGTTNPTSALHVSSNLGGLYNDMLLSGYNNGDIPIFNIRRARGTEASPTNLVNGDGIGGNHYYGYVNSTWTYSAGVGAFYKGSGTTNLSSLSFFTSGIENMYLDENGRLGIGCNNPQYDLHVIGNVGISGNMRAASTTTGATTACSDFRYKTNIHPLSNALENILKLQGVTYDWRIKDFPEWHFNNRKQIGVIAQEVEKIYPELVETDEKGYKSVDYSKMTPILVEAIKSQQTIIEKQKKEIDDLKNQSIITQRELENMKKQMAQFSVQLEALVKKQN
jgi:Chaperone of endosialidase